ncbi:MAG: T9SS type A sorting domain-containing protein [Chlorobi bacterium]|nr:T9SS type A sorting domain-containing protein [Chlorobiota bacterium]
MKNFILKPYFFIFIILCYGTIQAQNIVKVAPGFATLNNAIEAEAAKGVEVVSNTIFELKRGATYLLNGSIRNDGFTLNIRAEDGDGARPRLIPAVASGGESERPFRPRGDLSIKGLFVTNKDELGRVNLRIIRCSADNITIKVDDCTLDMDNQSAIRLDNDNISIFLTNSTISNIGLPSDPANGRGVDDRGNDIDTLVIENCTFYNITSRILRDGGGIINYCKINHNHFVNIGQRLITFGEVIEAELTNNMVINAGFYGAYPGSNYELVELDSIKKDLSDQGIVQSVKINNNNFFTDPAITGLYPDSISATPVFDVTARAFVEEQGTAGTQLNENVSFTKGAVLPTYIVSVFWGNPANTPPWDNTGAPYDFEYAGSYQSYSYSDTGQPLGDLRWFDMDIISGAKGLFNESGDELSFKSYPNPANGDVNFGFKLESGKNIEIGLYNMMGQKISTVVESYFTAGAHTINHNVSNLIPGIYILKIKAGGIYNSKTIIIK